MNKTQQIHYVLNRTGTNTSWHLWSDGSLHPGMTRTLLDNAHLSHSFMGELGSTDSDCFQLLHNLHLFWVPNLLFAELFELNGNSRNAVMLAENKSWSKGIFRTALGPEDYCSPPVCTVESWHRCLEITLVVTEIKYFNLSSGCSLQALQQLSDTTFGKSWLTWWKERGALSQHHPLQICMVASSCCEHTFQVVCTTPSVQEQWQGWHSQAAAEEQWAGRKPELVGRYWDILGLEDALQRASIVNEHNWRAMTRTPWAFSCQGVVLQGVSVKILCTHGIEHL